jgi:DNA-binding protein
MFLWAFRPTLEDKVIPYILDKLSVPGETKHTAAIYLAESPLEPEYLSLTNWAESELWLAFPHISHKPSNMLLNTVDKTLSLRIITGNEQDAEQIKTTAQRYNREVEIVRRPRMHFKLLLTGNGLAVGSANFSETGLSKLHELVIISTNDRLLKETRSFLLAFVDEYSGYPTNGVMYSTSSSLPTRTKSLFVNTSNGLDDLVYSLLTSAKESLVLVSPYITNDVAEHILRAVSEEVQVRFITWVDWRQWATERSDPEAIEMFLANRFLVESCPNLHANCIIVDGKAAIISSQNLTTESWTSRDEAGIYTLHPKLVSDILERINSWPKTRYTLEALEQEIEQLTNYLGQDAAPSPQVPDQEEHIEFPLEVGEQISPPLLGFTLIPRRERLEREVPIPTREPVLEEEPVPVEEPAPTKPPVTVDEPELDQPLLERFWMKDVVFVGKKRLMEYVWASLTQLKKNQTVTLKARGQLIYRAVEVAELLRNKFEPDLELDKKAIQIDTFYPTGKKSKWGGISEIEITLQKKNEPS